MTFTPNIPQAGQSLGQTQAAVLNNFTNYANTIGVNHFAANTGNAGKHTFAEFVALAQSPATASGEVATYCRTVSGTSQLFLQKASQLAGASDIQMSRLDTGIATGTFAGYSFLPGGVIIQWGAFAFSGTNTSVTNNWPIPFTANVFSVVATAIGGSNAIAYLSTGTPLISFTLQRAGGGLSGQSVYVIAIGN